MRSLLLLAATWAASLVVSTQASADQWEQLYQQALKIRTSSTWKEQQQAIDLLIAAAGIRPSSKASKDAILTTHHVEQRPADEAGTPIPGFPDLLVAHDAHPGALRELAKALQEGQGISLNMRLALELFRHAADLGDAEAQGQMGWRYALGLQHLDSWGEQGIATFGEPDEESSLLHYYFGALGGDAFSRMALGHKHLFGLGVPKSCWSAATYYQPVAEGVSDASTQVSSMPHIERIRLHVQASQGFKAERHREVLQYYQHSADHGNVDAQTAVGQVLNYGTHGVERDHVQALHYLKQAAEAGDQEAMAHLGHMYANGFGAPQDFQAAYSWFTKAAQQGSGHALYGLGYMHLTGQGVGQDPEKAFKYFVQAAEQGHADAHFFLGSMHLRGLGVRRKSVQRAFSYFTLAAHAGHIMAMYNAAMMHMAGKGTARQCKPAVSLLKQVSEKGVVASVLQRGHQHFFKAQYSQAVVAYLQAAELGLELGQSNAAWMLDRGYTKSGGQLDHTIFRLYKRSAEQGNVNSLLLLGNCYFYGQGVEQDWVRASAIYYEAYQERAAEAMFNLGFMHEFGAGVPKDLQLARRFYLMAQHTQPDASAAVWVACAWLRVHEVWEAVRPHLPKQLDHVWSHVMILAPPHTSVLGPWVNWLKFLMPTQLLVHADVLFWHWMDVLGLSGLGSTAEAKDLGETMTLLGLLLVLYFVLKLRRQRAARFQAQVPAAAAAAGVAMPPAPDQAAQFDAAAEQLGPHD